MNTTIANWAITIGVSISAIVFIAGSVRWAGMPRLKEAITETINSTVGPSIAKVPELTIAVNRLTDALTQQSVDTDKLNTTMLSLETKFDNMVSDVGKLAQRTAVLEGAFPTIDFVAKIVESAALASKKPNRKKATKR